MPRGRQKSTLLEKYQCIKCKEFKSLRDHFYSTESDMFPNKKYPVCKSCFIQRLPKDKDLNSQEYLQAVKSILFDLNKPFIASLWQTSVEEFHKTGKDAFGMMLKNLSMPQNRHLTSKDNDYDDIRKIEVSSNYSSKNKESEYSLEEFEELQSFWGKGLSHEDLEFLQREYEKFLNSYECDSYAMELLFQEASHQRLTIKRLRQESKSVDKELKTFQDLLGSANVKPVQETGANAAEQATFGTLIKKYENERPIPEPDPAWQDVDGIKKYIQVWFLGHLCKMIGINNEYVRMYEEELSKHTVDNPTYQSDDDEEIGDIK